MSICLLGYNLFLLKPVGVPHCWWECKLVQPLWKTAGRCLKKLKIELPYDPAIPLLGIYMKNMKMNLKKYMHLNVYRNTIYNSQDMEAT